MAEAQPGSTPQPADNKPADSKPEGKPKGKPKGKAEGKLENPKPAAPAPTPASAAKSFFAALAGSMPVAPPTTAEIVGTGMVNPLPPDLCVQVQTNEQDDDGLFAITVHGEPEKEFFFTRKNADYFSNGKDKYTFQHGSFQTYKTDKSGNYAVLVGFPYRKLNSKVSLAVVGADGEEVLLTFRIRKDVSKAALAAMMEAKNG